MRESAGRNGGTQPDLGDHLVDRFAANLFVNAKSTAGFPPSSAIWDEKIQRSSGGTSFRAMVKSSDLGELYYRAQFGPLEGPRDGRVLGQR